MMGAHRADGDDPEYCPRHDAKVTGHRRNRYTAFGVGTVGGAGLLISAAIPLGFAFDITATASLIGAALWQMWQVTTAARLHDDITRCGPCRLIRRRASALQGRPRP